jgi:coproporphyrinogen III oxidase-like Fe-S oxidoreductase
VFPGSVTFDLIYGRMGQSVEKWHNELKVMICIVICLAQFVLKKNANLDGT